MPEPEPSAYRKFVPGAPAPQGSKRHIGRGRMLESSDAVGPWRERIALAVHRDRPQMFAGAVAVQLEFVMPRPAATPKRRTPPAIKRPDVDKLARAVLDALTGLTYTDDSHVVDLRARKRLADPVEAPGVHIEVVDLSVSPAQPISER